MNRWKNCPIDTLCECAQLAVPAIACTLVRTHMCTHLTNYAQYNSLSLILQSSVEAGKNKYIEAKAFGNVAAFLNIGGILFGLFLFTVGGIATSSIVAILTCTLTGGDCTN